MKKKVISARISRPNNEDTIAQGMEELEQGTKAWEREHGIQAITISEFFVPSCVDFRGDNGSVGIISGVLVRHVREGPPLTNPE